MFLGVDVGGTKVAVGVVDRGGVVVRREQRATPRGDGEAVFEVVRALVLEMAGGGGTGGSAGGGEGERGGFGGILGVGVGCAGPVDGGRGEVSPVNIGGWRGFPLRQRVAELMPGMPVVLAGDGVCMAVGDQWVGAGSGSLSMVGVVVSTGVGGGLVLDGRGYGGRTGNAG
ncbi:ROK family protein, partial [Actinokineospora sp.]|uniref:ROK family protein n=1 Tax=Actinokineospora sp. TaxID=1872133 RepID=UPI0040377BD5